MGISSYIYSNGAYESVNTEEYLPNESKKGRSIFGPIPEENILDLIADIPLDDDWETRLRQRLRSQYFSTRNVHSIITYNRNMGMSSLKIIQIKINELFQNLYRNIEEHPLRYFLAASTVYLLPGYIVKNYPEFGLRLGLPTLKKINDIVHATFAENESKISEIINKTIVEIKKSFYLPFLKDFITNFNAKWDEIVLNHSSLNILETLFLATKIAKHECTLDFIDLTFNSDINLAGDFAKTAKNLTFLREKLLLDPRSAQNYLFAITNDTSIVDPTKLDVCIESKLAEVSNKYMSDTDASQYLRFLFKISSFEEFEKIRSLLKTSIMDLKDQYISDENLKKISLDIAKKITSFSVKTNNKLFNRLVRSSKKSIIDYSKHEWRLIRSDVGNWVHQTYKKIKWYHVVGFVSIVAVTTFGYWFAKKISHKNFPFKPNYLKNLEQKKLNSLFRNPEQEVYRSLPAAFHQIENVENFEHWQIIKKSQIRNYSPIPIEFCDDPFLSKRRCPITGTVVRVPVTIENYTYERAHILEWYYHQLNKKLQPRCPMTGIILNEQLLEINYDLSDEIELRLLLLKAQALKAKKITNHTPVFNSFLEVIKKVKKIAINAIYDKYPRLRNLKNMFGIK